MLLALTADLDLEQLVAFLLVFLLFAVSVGDYADLTLFDQRDYALIRFFSDDYSGLGVEEEPNEQLHQVISN